MKKMCLIVLGLMASFLGFSQRAAFGIKGGLNIADYSPEAGSVDSRVAYHLGVLAHFHVQPDVAIQPEVVFSSQGAKFSNSTDELDYINIPVLVQYMFARGFRLETGPQLGFNVSSKNTSYTGDEARLNDVKSTDFSWAFGLGYLTPSGFGLDARYNLGLSNIAIPDYGIKNRVWQFGVFYQFNH